MSATLDRLSTSVDPKLWAKSFVQAAFEDRKLPQNELAMAHWFAVALLTGYRRGKFNGLKEAETGRHVSITEEPTAQVQTSRPPEEPTTPSGRQRRKSRPTTANNHPESPQTKEIPR